MGPRSCHPLALALCLAFVACGPSGGAGSDSTSGSSGVIIGTSSSDGPGASESTIAGTTSTECAEIYVGDLHVTADTDLASLAQIGKVTGWVTVGYEDFVDLSFLGCLREIGETLNIHVNENLVSLAGLERLEVADRIWIGGNRNLVDLSAMNQVVEVYELSINGNGTSDLGFDGLERVEYLRMGECGSAPGEDPPPEIPPALTEIKGFASLSSIGVVRIAGQTELVSLGRLHEIASAGGLGSAGVFNNFKLPYAEIEQLEAEAGDDFAACGNLDDPEPLCWESDQFPSACTAPPP